jgi:hypothetical protein
MGQPQTRYEQLTDLLNENAVADILRARWGWDRLDKLPEFRPLDRVAFRGKIIAGFVEIKCRCGLTHGFGDGYYIATNKVVAAINMQAVYDVPTILAVRFSDNLIWWTRLRGPYRGIWAGRKDRPSDPFAMEEHAVIPWDQFKRVVP